MVTFLNKDSGTSTQYLVTSLNLDLFGTASIGAVLNVLRSESVHGLANNFTYGKESLLTVGTLIESVSNCRDLGS